MDAFARGAIGDDDLLRNALLHARTERATTAMLLADIGEIDARRLFVRAGYASLVEYCRGAMRLSEDAAARRIHAARAARRFPAIFGMCADGRLSLTAVNQLAPHLTELNARELLAAAAGKAKGQIEELIRVRKPTTELIGWVQPLPAPCHGSVRALADEPSRPPAPAIGDAPSPSSRSSAQAPRAEGLGAASPAPAPARVDPLAARRSSTAPARVRPIACGRFAVQGTIGKHAVEALRFALESTGRDVSTVLEAALVLYEAHLRKRRSGASGRPLRRPRGTRNVRHVPAHVRRRVWERDGGRCTFRSDDGQRCGSTWRLEYDHIIPVARGGESTFDNVRLRCRAHNQYEAERTFGAAFMAGRRERVRRGGRDGPWREALPSARGPACDGGVAR